MKRRKVLAVLGLSLFSILVLLNLIYVRPLDHVEYGFESVIVDRPAPVNLNKCSGEARIAAKKMGSRIDTCNTISTENYHLVWLKGGPYRDCIMGCIPTSRVFKVHENNTIVRTNINALELQHKCRNDLVASEHRKYCDLFT